jgi:ABC-2 type transport system permease protein
MTTTQVRADPRALTEVPPGARGDRFVVQRLTLRLLRRGIGFLGLAVAVYLTVEVLGYRAAYPDTAARGQIAKLAQSGAVRALPGIPEALDTPGGYAVWDGGWLLALIVGTWALLTATRLLRGEEASGRAELALCRPVTERRLAIGQLEVLGLGLLVVAVAAAVPLIVLGEPVSGSLLFGCGLAAFGAVFGAVGAVAAQVLDPRRRAVTAGAGALLLSFVVRTYANSSAGREGLLPLTPSGWLDGLDPFADDHWLGLVPLLVTAAALAAVAVLLRGSRDLGTGLLHVADAHPPRRWLLGGAVGYGWRATTGALVAWTVGCAVMTGMLGTMARSIADFMRDDPTYRDMMEQLGLDMSQPVDAYVSLMAVAMALAFGLFVCWRVGAVRQEEAEGRLDLLLVRPVPRVRWLTATFVLALVAATVVVVASGVAFWLGAVAADAGVGAWQAVGPMLQTLPLVVLYAGLTVLTFGVAPRLTVALPATGVVVGYLLDLFGPLFDWPSALVAVSPFHHLARLPSDPFSTGSAAVMTAIGLALAGLGIARFARRDLTGA